MSRTNLPDDHDGAVKARGQNGEGGSVGYRCAGLRCAVSSAAQAETYWELGDWNVTQSPTSCSLNTRNMAVGSLHVQLGRDLRHAMVSFISNRVPTLSGTNTANLKVYFRDNQIVLTDWGGTYPFRYAKTDNGAHFYAFASSSSYKTVLHAFASNEYVIFTDVHEDLVGVYALKGAMRGVEKLEECAANLNR